MDKLSHTDQQNDRRSLHNPTRKNCNYWKKPRQQQTFKGMMSSYYKKHLVNNMISLKMICNPVFHVFFDSN